MSFAPFPSTLQDRFAAIIRALCMGLAVRHAGPMILPHPLYVAVHTFLSRRIGRFARLLARVRAGTIRPPSSRPVAPPRPPPAHPRAPVQALSRRRGWLLGMIPNAAAYASQLSHLIAQPDMAELVARAPGLGRLLRPLAQVLAIDLPAALQRPKPPRPKPEKPKPPLPDHTLPSRRPPIVIGHRKRPRIVFEPG